MRELTSERIQSALTTRRLGHPALFYERVGSTNDVVHARAAAGAAEGLLVVAEEQTAGRGRLDRTWWAPPGSSLLVSLLFRPSATAHLAGQLAMCLGLGAVEGIEDVTGLRPALKWPNDLVMGGRKLGGMLSETRLVGDRLDWAVLGLGLNVNLDFSGAPSSLTDLSQVATSLSLALGRPVDRLPLLAAILSRCEAWYDRWLLAQKQPAVGGGAGGQVQDLPLQHGGGLAEAWAARLDTLGRQVTVAMPGGLRSGVAIGVSPEGALLLRADDGRVHAVWSGDVTSLRSAVRSPAPG